MFPKQIIDISYCQPNFDFKTARNMGYTGVIIRNGYLGKTDTEFKRNIENAIKNKFDIGTYTYNIGINYSQLRTEALETYERIRPYSKYINLPVFADFEDKRYLNMDPSKLTRLVIEFLEMVMITGFLPGLYSNPDFLENRLHRTQLESYDLWLAYYTNKHDTGNKYTLKYQPAIWQYGTEKISGLTTDSNNVFYDLRPRAEAYKNYWSVSAYRQIDINNFNYYAKEILS